MCGIRDAIVDIGPKSCAAFKRKIAGAKTIVWSGPFGLIDMRPYERGSLEIAQAIAKNRKALSVAGGGRDRDVLEAGPPRQEIYFHLDRRRRDARFSRRRKDFPGIEACS